MGENGIDSLYESMDRFREIQRTLEDGVSIEEKVELLNEQQTLSAIHPLTCNRVHEGCETKEFPDDYSKDGVLIATENGWVCPCGKYTQKL